MRARERDVAVEAHADAPAVDEAREPRGRDRAVRVGVVGEGGQQGGVGGEGVEGVEEGVGFGVDGVGGAEDRGVEGMGGKEVGVDL